MRRLSQPGLVSRRRVAAVQGNALLAAEQRRAFWAEIARLRARCRGSYSYTSSTAGPAKGVVLSPTVR